MSKPSILIRVIIGILILLSGYFIGFGAYFATHQWALGYYWGAVEKAYQQQFKDDTVGGATPEETWNMFISALEQGDVDTAAEYFSVSTRKEGKSSLSSRVDKGTLDEFVVEIKENFLSAEKDVVSDDDIRYKYTEFQEAGSYTVEYPDGRLEVEEFPAGEYEGRIHFVKNINNVWKIYNL